MNKTFKSTSTFQSVDTIYMRVSSEKNYINLNPPYQRNVVWHQQQQSMFINSICHEIIPTNLIFNMEPNGSFVCIDGKQRISSIVNFIKNQIPLRLENDPLQIYYSEIPDNEDETCYRIMTSEERKKFDNVNIPVVTYDELTYEDQVDIFNRIQNGTALKHGELVNAMFVNDKITQRYDTFCNSKTKLFSKFGRIGADRKGHYTFIVTLMIMISEKDYKLPTKAQRSKFIKNITTMITLNEHLKKVNTLIDVCLGPNILGDTTIPNSFPPNAIYALCAVTHKNYLNELDKMKSGTNEKLLSSSRKIYRIMAGINKDGSRMKREQFKTMSELINKFDNIRKDIIREHCEMTDDEDDYYDDDY